jgi:hypothetical protein
MLAAVLQLEILRCRNRIAAANIENHHHKGAAGGQQGGLQGRKLTGGHFFRSIIILPLLLPSYLRVTNALSGSSFKRHIFASLFLTALGRKKEAQNWHTTSTSSHQATSLE